MKVKEITIGISQTINVGNYETIRPSVTLKGALESGDDIDKAREKLSEMAQYLYMREVLSQLALYNSKNTGGYSTITDWAAHFLSEYNNRVKGS